MGRKTLVCSLKWLEVFILHKGYPLEVSLMKCWIITTGDEILQGKTLDYNSFWIGKRLTGIGVEVARKSTVPDEKEEIARVIKMALDQNFDLIVTIGGLGPTPRDDTLEAVADSIDKELQFNREAFQYMKRAYSRLAKLGFVDSPEINDARRKMAMLPNGATPLKNEVGGAPAVITSYEKSFIVSLPGIPSEMMYCLEQAVPFISEQLGETGIVRTREFYMEKGDESKIAQTLQEVMDTVEGVHVKSYPVGFGKDMKMKIMATARAESPSQAEKKIERAVSLLHNLLEREQ